MSVLDVQNLRIDFGSTPVVHGISARIEGGECLALIGESGSGKSVTGRALLGLAGPGARVRAEVLSVAGTDIATASPRGLRKLRGGGAALIPQDALIGLDPLRPIGREIDRTLQLHTTLSAPERRRRVVELLSRVGIPDPDARASSRPGELSGGLRQRALIASALAGNPALLIADEPTTALDARVRGGILRLLGSLRDEGMALLLISHDLTAVSGIADRVAVMNEGRILEEGPPTEVLRFPRESYTRRLLAASPAGKPRFMPLLAQASTPRADDPAPEPARTTLRAEGLYKTFSRRGLSVPAVRDVSVRLESGRTLGLVGESGSGKSTVARLLLGLETPDAGTVTLDAHPWAPLPESQRRTRRSQLAAIYQDPMGSFDPRLTVGQILAEALSSGRTIRVAAERSRITAAMDRVGLSPTLRERRPITLSGGQRQRLAIARALAGEPRILLCDEPVSALDLSIQAQVLDLLDDIQRERGLTMLFISHDLDVVEHMSDSVAVMTAGQLVESGPTARVFHEPHHEYTRALLAEHRSERP